MQSISVFGSVKTEGSNYDRVIGVYALLLIAVSSLGSALICVDVTKLLLLANLFLFGLYSLFKFNQIRFDSLQILLLSLFLISTSLSLYFGSPLNTILTYIIVLLNIIAMTSVFRMLNVDDLYIFRFLIFALIISCLIELTTILFFGYDLFPFILSCSNTRELGYIQLYNSFNAFSGLGVTFGLNSLILGPQVASIIFLLGISVFFKKSVSKIVFINIILYLGLCILFILFMTITAAMILAISLGIYFLFKSRSQFSVGVLVFWILLCSPIIYFLISEIHVGFDVFLHTYVDPAFDLILKNDVRSFLFGSETNYELRHYASEIGFFKTWFSIGFVPGSLFFALFVLLPFLYSVRRSDVAGLYICMCTLIFGLSFIHYSSFLKTGGLFLGIFFCSLACSATNQFRKGIE